MENQEKNWNNIPAKDLTTEVGKIFAAVNDSRLSSENKLNPNHLNKISNMLDVLEDNIKMIDWPEQILDDWAIQIDNIIDELTKKYQLKKEKTRGSGDHNQILASYNAEKTYRLNRLKQIYLGKIALRNNVYTKGVQNESV
jgi:hypothetical protein